MSIPVSLAQFLGRLDVHRVKNARLWFRYRCQIIENIKGNISLQWRDDMGWRHCTTREHETQDHLERCSFFKNKRDLTKRMHKLIFWRQVTRTLKDMYAKNKDIKNNHTNNIISK